jgi:hypothetical protein
VQTTLARLDAEWRDLAGSPQSTAALAEWQRHESALGEGGDLDDLLERRRDPAAAPAILGALARLAPTEPLAARTLLHALIPGLVRLDATSRYDDPAALDELVSLAWERIRTYPTTRLGWWAANVLLDTRKRYRSHRAIESPRNADVTAIRSAPTAPSAESVVLRTALGNVVVSELASAHRAGVINDQALDVIVRTRLAGEALEAVAVDHGCTVTRLGQLRWRAEQRLRPRFMKLAG